MIRHQLKAKYQKEPFILALSNARAAVHEQELSNDQKSSQGVAPFKNPARDSTRYNIEAKRPIKQVNTGVLIWNFQIPRYNRKAMQTERNNQNGKR